MNVLSLLYHQVKKVMSVKKIKIAKKDSSAWGMFAQCQELKVTFVLLTHIVWLVSIVSTMNVLSLFYHLVKKETLAKKIKTVKMASSAWEIFARCLEFLETSVLLIHTAWLASIVTITNVLSLSYHLVKKVMTVKKIKIVR